MKVKVAIAIKVANQVAFKKNDNSNITIVQIFILNYESCQFIKKIDLGLKKIEQYMVLVLRSNDSDLKKITVSNFFE